MKYFTDSLITLYRIHNDPTTYKVWVANRLIMIQKMTKKHEWYFCEGHLNFPGDTASRGAKLSDFIEKKEWLSGPSFLTNPDHVYTTLDQLKLSRKEKLSDANKKKKVLPTFHHTFVSHHLNIVQENQLGLEIQISKSKNKKLDFYEANDRKSKPKKIGILYCKPSWAKTVRILGWIIRYITRLRTRAETRRKLTQVKLASENYKSKLRKRPEKVPKDLQKMPKKTEKISVKMPELTVMKEEDFVYEFMRLTSEETLASELHLFRYAQFTSFSSEISQIRAGLELSPSNKMIELIPFWSKEDNLLRMFNRWTPGSTPIILPKGHRVSDLFIHYIHTLFNHSSVSHTMHRMNQRVHVIGSRREIQRVLRCCQCSSPVQLYQRMSTLPNIDYSPTSISKFIQIDMAGPFMVVNDKGELSKTWCAVFICLVSRLCTVKLLRSCSTKDLILGIRSYVSLRGRWQIAFSDGAAQFHAASRELRTIISNINWKNVLEEVLTLHMEWRFNVPLSPHRTGAAENMVKLVKNGLYKAIKNKTLDFERLSVVFEEVSSVINSRPLGYVKTGESSNDKELMISPSILCYGRDVDILPMQVKIEDIPTISNTPLQKIYHDHRKQLSLFWKAYYDSYFNFLKFSKKWFHTLNYEIKPDSFVLVKEPSLKKFEYRTARVIKAIKSQDGLVRTLEVKFGRNKKPVLRNIQMCAMLECDYLKLLDENHKCFYSSQTSSA